MSKEMLRRTLLLETADDEVGLWLVARWVRQEGDLEDEGAVREATLDLLGEMLRDGVIKAGYPDAHHRRFRPWSISAEEVITRIVKEWRALGRPPRLGEIAWFAATTKGEQEALRHERVECPCGTFNIGDHSSVE